LFGRPADKCLRIKKEKSGAWQDYFDTIIGFKPKAGWFYKIEVVRVGDSAVGTAGRRHRLSAQTGAP
jgi:hypothetical protein